MVIVVVRIIHTVLSVMTEQDGINFRFRFRQSLAVKVLTLDYEYLESPEGQNQIARANEGLENDQRQSHGRKAERQRILCGILQKRKFILILTISWVIRLRFILAIDCPVSAFAIKLRYLTMEVLCRWEVMRS